MIAKPAKSRHHRRPVDRVRRALTRLSRDRWLSGEEVEAARMALARCCSAVPSSVAKHACADECTVIGMIRGQPPVYRWDDGYPAFVRSLYGIKTSRKAEVELLILKLVLTRSEYGR